MLRTWWFWVVLAIGVGAAATAASTVEYWAGHSPRAQAEEQRERMLEVRSALDRCMTQLDRWEQSFWSHERETTLLRSQIERFESLDPEGVPMDRYEEYLDVFEQYNEAIPIWEARADSVRAQHQRCGTLAERFNEKRDALERFMVREGIWDASEGG